MATVQQIDQQMGVMSDRYIKQPQPEIGTEILDDNLPSQLNFSPKKQSSENPEQFSNTFKDQDSRNYIKSFRVSGKGIFNVDATYSQDEIVRKSLDTFSVKAFDQKKSGGFKKLWQSMIGFSKRELYIENGYIYIFESAKSGLQCKSATKIQNLVHMFVDLEQSTIRLVFKEQGSRKLQNKNYQLDKIIDLIKRLMLEANIIGIKITQQSL